MRIFVLRDAGIVDRAIDYLHGLDLAKRYEMVVRIHKTKRSADQNARYWGILGIIAEDTGHSSSEIHEWCKHEFLGWDVVCVMEKEIQIPKSTTRCNTKQFADYCTRVEAWAASEMGVKLPPW